MSQHISVKHSKLRALFTREKINKSDELELHTPSRLGEAVLRRQCQGVDADTFARPVPSTDLYLMKGASGAKVFCASGKPSTVTSVLHWMVEHLLQRVHIRQQAIAKHVNVLDYLVSPPQKNCQTQDYWMCSTPESTCYKKSVAATTKLSILTTKTCALERTAATQHHGTNSSYSAK